MELWSLRMEKSFRMKRFPPHLVWTSLHSRKSWKTLQMMQRLWQVAVAAGNTVWEYEKKKKGFWRVFSLIPAIVSVIAFILTENMRLPMRLVDRWTLLMVIIAIVQIVVAVLCKKRKNKDDEDRDDQQNQDAATVTA